MNPFGYMRYFYRQLRGYLLFGRRVAVYGHFEVGNVKNIQMGANCAINHNVFILGHCKVDIGNAVVLSTGAMLIDSGLQIQGFADTESPSHLKSHIKIADGVWIGAGAIILPGVTVGRKSIVGAGSVVTRDVPAFTIVAGNPARAIGRTDI
jgi:maltose O-acetyltransferase